MTFMTVSPEDVEATKLRLTQIERWLYDQDQTELAHWISKIYVRSTMDRTGRLKHLKTRLERVEKLVAERFGEQAI